jgi:uridine kinase
VDKKFCDYLPLFTRIDELMETQQNIVLAIDGSSAAGKSSLAEMLKSVYSCNLFTMDDFFLQPFQRTAQRLEEPGENIDYERFESEIIRGLKTGGPFQYEIFDCDTEELSSPIEVSPKTLSVVEGVYSLHPNYSDSYDIKVFLKIDEAEQLRRLKERSPGLYQRFIDEWIPMENKYFEFFRVADKCDLIFNTGDKGM